MEMDITKEGNIGNRAFRCQTFNQKNTEDNLCHMNMGKLNFSVTPFLKENILEDNYKKKPDAVNFSVMFLTTIILKSEMLSPRFFALIFENSSCSNCRQKGFMTGSNNR